MMDYDGFWQGFMVLFGIVPALAGAAIGTLWAWRQGRRGGALTGPAVAGAVAVGICAFAAAALFFRA